ncbi:hypothetical protein RN001_004658 [Aquatica leii]|uniref:Uncharacterized protein n=1 Tax=Aquatica leii TaxID=1421715 RepID=A0AAN7SI46_9COLE|nr:hypothetical protein RN001_004658 [Aquatica leii]
MENHVLEEILQIALAAESSLIPSKSQKIYENEYSKLIHWNRSKNARTLTKKVVLAYMSEQCLFSKLKCIMKIKKNIDKSQFHNVSGFLKRSNVGYAPKKSLIFSRARDQFLVETLDDTYLMMKLKSLNFDNCTKVVVIFGICGPCEKIELYNLCVLKILQKRINHKLHIYYLSKFLCLL